MGLTSQHSSVSGFDWSQLEIWSGSGRAVGVPKPAPRNRLQRPQIWPPLRCPRCDSANTKFCYYNNYSRSQPRYLCKACRRHWTEGGTLRNVPVGGGRKNKRNKATTSKAAAATTAAATATATATAAAATAAAATAINSSSIDDPAAAIFPEILRRVLLRSPPPLPPPVAASSDYGIMSTLMSSLQSDQIVSITAEPNTTVTSYGSALAQVSFFGYSGDGLGTMSGASNAWHVAPHAQPPGEAVAAALEASATTAGGLWTSEWPDEEVSGLAVPELDPSLTGHDL